MTKPFETDGCSGSLNWLWKLVYRTEQPPFCQCCVEHDWAYWKGGTNLQRATADADLFACVVASGSPWFAILVWIGVRIGGAKWMPWGWTWGWGNDD